MNGPGKVTDEEVLERVGEKRTLLKIIRHKKKSSGLDLS